MEQPGSLRDYLRGIINKAVRSMKLIFRLLQESDEG